MNYVFRRSNKLFSSRFFAGFDGISKKSSDSRISSKLLTPSSSSSSNSRPSLPDRYLGQPSWKTHPNLIAANEVTPGISRDEYAQRRDRFLFKLIHDDDSKSTKKNFDETSRHLVIIGAARTAFSAPDVPYPFRQDSNFLYLTGFREPDAILILYNENSSDSTSTSSPTKSSICRSILFVAERNEHRELWEGPRAGVDGAKALTDVDFVYEHRELYEFLRNYAKNVCGGKRFVLWKDPKKRIQLNVPTKEFPMAIGGKETKANLDVDLDQYLSQYSTTSSQAPSLNPIPILHELRWRKSKAEIDLLRRAGRIGAESMIETMRFSRQHPFENVLAAKMDLECRVRGADCLAYPPVVAGGARANIIHYLNNDQRITERENLVLMDAGCEFGGYVSDITRTWPVTGRFTDPQRVVYELLQQVQYELLDFVRTVRPITLRDVFVYMLQLLAVGIRESGILTDANANDEELIRQANRLCPHHVSHYLGMDVHDVDSVSKQRQLEPGVIITVEPGIYIRPDDVSIREEFRGVGIRIEDDVAIMDDGAEVLSERVPKRASEIEEILNR